MTLSLSHLVISISELFSWLSQYSQFSSSNNKAKGLLLWSLKFSDSSTLLVSLLLSLSFFFSLLLLLLIFFLLIFFGSNFKKSSNCFSFSFFISSRDFIGMKLYIFLTSFLTTFFDFSFLFADFLILCNFNKRLVSLFLTELFLIK